MTASFGRLSAARAGGGPLEALRGSTHQQQLLRTAMVGGAVAGIGATEAAGEVSGPGVAVIALALMVAVTRPDSHGAAVAIIVFGIQWFGGVDDVRTPWVVAAAASMLVLHTTAALAAIAPPTATSPRALLARWGVRSAVVLGVAVAVWAAAFVLEEVDTPSSVALAAAGSLSLLGLILLLWPRRA